MPGKWMGHGLALALVGWGRGGGGEGTGPAGRESPRRHRGQARQPSRCSDRGAFTEHLLHAGALCLNCNLPSSPTSAREEVPYFEVFWLRLRVCSQGSAQLAPSEPCRVLWGDLARPAGAPPSLGPALVAWWSPGGHPS